MSQSSVDSQNTFVFTEYIRHQLNMQRWKPISFEPTDLVGAILSPYGNTPTKEEKARLKGVERSEPGGDILLCRACGWTTYNETCSSYLPRLRILHTTSNAGMWAMGNDWIIWDRGPKSPECDYQIYQFLKEKGTQNIPLVKEMHQFGKSGDPY